jgi:cyclopropane fatty-acyl-phospholipid synthase-like methyltransferase
VSRLVDGLVVSGHLGGYVPGGDPATQYPELWRWLTGWANVSSVLDVGCGDGQALKVFRMLGCEVQGIDGLPQDDPDIIEHDFTRGPYTPSRRFDLVWSCEFVEHVDERYSPNFLETFKAGRLVLMTHAFPGQGGHHHVNCQPADYWIRKLASIGYSFDETLTAATRNLARANAHPANHYARSGLAFRKAR